MSRFNYLAPIESLGLDRWVNRYLRDIGATTVGVICIMTISDLICHFDDSTCEKIRKQLEKAKMSLKSEGTDLNNRVAGPFGSIPNIPVAYLQAYGIIGPVQRITLDFFAGVSTWGELAKFGKNQLLDLRFLDGVVFEPESVNRIDYLLRRHRLLLNP